MSNRKLLDQFVNHAAQKYGVDANTMRGFIGIESGWNPNNTTGSYKGLFQLSDDEFRKRGGQGNIYNPQSNINAGALQIKALTDDYKRRYGRDPEPHELYMMHQQGAGGYSAHSADPNRPAWQSMASTKEGRQKGAAWAKQAIWGNIPTKAKQQYGSVDNVSSGQFMKFWQDRFNRELGNNGVQLASAEPGPPQPTWDVSTQDTTPTQAPAPTNWGAMIAQEETSTAPKDNMGLGDVVGMAKSVLGSAPRPPSVRMVQAPAPNSKVNMSTIGALLKTAGKSKFGKA